jgi:hypothetical protein
VKTYAVNNSSGHTFYVMNANGTAPDRATVEEACSAIGGRLVDIGCVCCMRRRVSTPWVLSADIRIASCWGRPKHPACCICREEASSCSPMENGNHPGRNGLGVQHKFSFSILSRQWQTSWRGSPGDSSGSPLDGHAGTPP